MSESSNRFTLLLSKTLQPRCSAQWRMAGNMFDVDKRGRSAQRLPCCRSRRSTRQSLFPSERLEIHVSTPPKNGANLPTPVYGVVVLILILICLVTLAYRNYDLMIITNVLVTLALASAEVTRRLVRTRCNANGGPFFQSAN